MKRNRFAALMAAVLLFSAGVACAAAEDRVPGPRLYLEQTSFDFGKVVEGATLEHTFKVFNRGDQPLLIHKVRPS
jgi:hypothetical protein